MRACCRHSVLLRTLQTHTAHLIIQSLYLIIVYEFIRVQHWLLIRTQKLNNEYGRFNERLNNQFDHSLIGEVQFDKKCKHRYYHS